MKKRKEITAAVLCIGALFWAISDTVAQTSTSTQKYAGKNPGQLMGSGTIRWRLATLSADTDTSMVATALLNVWNNSNTEVPRVFLVSMYSDSAAGGGAGSRVHLRMYKHFLSTETAGAGIAQWFSRGNNLVAIDTLNLAIGAGSSAATHAFLTDPGTLAGTAVPYSQAPGLVSIYLSLRVDKEGVKRFTAGYLDIYWKAYR